jgi:hypothetical protein
MLYEAVWSVGTLDAFDGGLEREPALGFSLPHCMARDFCMRGQVTGMGRTNPTYRDQIRGFEQDYSQYRRALRRSRQETFDEVITHAQDLAAAGGAASSHTPAVPILLSICIRQQEQINELQKQVETGR